MDDRGRKGWRMGEGTGEKEGVSERVWFSFILSEKCEWEMEGGCYSGR